MVSRTLALTAAVCVTSYDLSRVDTRPINLVVGATYRHPRRGVRVPVLKTLIPNLLTSPDSRGYLMEKSVAGLILKSKVPDILMEVPYRPIDVDWLGEEQLSLQEECLMPGWHFFFKGDKIYPVHKFLLQRSLRVQFLNIVKKNLYCEALSIKFRKGLSNLGFHGEVDQGACMCTRDGMYGAPLICRGRAVAMLMAPDAQWTNCTGHSNIVHLFSSNYLRKFMTCISSMFEPETKFDWNVMKNSVYEHFNENEFDYVPEIYDRLDSGGSSSSSENYR